MLFRLFWAFSSNASFKKYDANAVIAIKTINVGKIANNSSIYLGLGAEYGFKMFPAKGMDGIVNNNYFSIYPQFGVMWPHFELSCYWKTYTVSPFDKYASSNFDEYKCNSLLGMQMSVYF